MTPSHQENHHNTNGSIATTMGKHQDLDDATTRTNNNNGGIYDSNEEEEKEASQNGATTGIMSHNNNTESSDNANANQNQKDIENDMYQNLGNYRPIVEERRQQNQKLGNLSAASPANLTTTESHQNHNSTTAATTTPTTTRTQKLKLLHTISHHILQHIALKEPFPEYFFQQQRGEDSDDDDDMINRVTSPAASQQQNQPEEDPLLPLHYVSITEIHSPTSVLKMLLLSRLDVWHYIGQVYRFYHQRQQDEDEAADLRQKRRRRRRSSSYDASSASSYTNHRNEPLHSHFTPISSSSASTAQIPSHFFKHHCASMDQFLHLTILPNRRVKRSSIVWEFDDEYSCVEMRQIDAQGNLWSELKWDGVMTHTGASQFSTDSTSPESTTTSAQILKYIQQMQTMLDFSDAQLATWIIIALQNPSSLSTLLRQDYSKREIRLIWSLVSSLLIQLFVVDVNRNSSCLMLHLILLILIREEFELNEELLLDANPSSSQQQHSSKSSSHQMHTKITFAHLLEQLSPVHFPPNSNASLQESPKLIHFISKLTELRLFCQHWRHDPDDEAWALWTESPLHVSFAYESEMTPLEVEIRRRELLVLDLYEQYTNESTRQLSARLHSSTPSTTNTTTQPSSLDHMEDLLVNLVRSEFFLSGFDLLNSKWETAPKFARYRKLALYDAITSPPLSNNRRMVDANFSMWKLSYDIHHRALNSDIMSFISHEIARKQRDTLLTHISIKTNQLIQYIYETGSFIRREHFNQQQGLPKDINSQRILTEWKDRIFQFVVNGANVDGIFSQEAFEEAQRQEQQNQGSTHSYTYRSMSDALLSDTYLGSFGAALTPLNVAIVLGQLEVVQFLVQYCQADVNYGAPLLVAIQAREAPIVEFLLDVQRVDLRNIASDLGTIALQCFDFAVFGVLVGKLPSFRLQYYDEYLRQSRGLWEQEVLEQQQEAEDMHSDEDDNHSNGSNLNSARSSVAPSSARVAISPLATHHEPSPRASSAHDSPRLHANTLGSSSTRMTLASSSAGMVHDYSPAASSSMGRRLSQHSPLVRTPFSAASASPLASQHQRQMQVRTPHWHTTSTPHSNYSPRRQSVSQSPSSQYLDINAPEHPFNREADDFLSDDSTDEETAAAEDEMMNRLSSLKPSPLYLSENVRKFAKPLMKFAVRKNRDSDANAGVGDESEEKHNVSL